MPPQPYAMHTLARSLHHRLRMVRCMPLELWLRRALAPCSMFALRLITAAAHTVPIAPRDALHFAAAVPYLAFAFARRMPSAWLLLRRALVPFALV
jgi:hypothetical protein